jgi:hypothetical protein
MKPYAICLCVPSPHAEQAGRAPPELGLGVKS